MKKKVYIQPIVEQMEIKGASIMDSFGVSTVPGEYNGGGNAPQRRGDVIG